MANNIHRAFLEERTMVVKIGTSVSKPCQITGSAVQGSVLGVLDHHAVLDGLDDGIGDLYVAKYVDDIMLVETVDRGVKYDKDLTKNKELHTFNPPTSQSAQTAIATKANEKHLKLNIGKTQLLTVLVCSK